MSEKGFTLWFTGLPCSGKTSLSDAVEKELRSAGRRVEHLDGDVVRRGLSKGLGFSKEDRRINLERVAFVASLLARNGVATLVSFVSPYRSMRDDARAKIENFIEVYVRCPLEVCESRDVKGMYKKARNGEIAEFTGVSDPYEEPLKPEIAVDTDRMELGECRERVLGYLEKRGLVVTNPFPGNEPLTKAFELARRRHRGQERKGGLPYLTHPVAVARMLRRAGYSDDIVAAGLLHDVLEDTGCELEEMVRAVGERVTGIVIEVTERDQTLPWEERKENYLRVLSRASPEALAVACADKTHNLGDLVSGYEARGDSFAALFSGRFGRKLENYRRLYDLIASRAPACALLGEYKKNLEALDRAYAEKQGGWKA